MLDEILSLPNGARYYKADLHVHTPHDPERYEHKGKVTAADIIAGANNGIHLLRDVGPLGRQAWPMFHRDEANTGAAP